MKRTLLSMLLCSTFTALFAQTPFPTIDSLNVNNLNATFLVHGDMWWNPALMSSHCYYPANSHKSISSTGALWMSGYDDVAVLHAAAQTYRQDGNDYWPGPLATSGSITYDSSQKWAKIWKVNRNEIQAFRLLSDHTIANTPEPILTWPASGNTYARGNGGANLSIPAGTQLAPFEDMNGNGIYEPLLGDYPKVKGDQALWYIFNDDGPNHNVTSTMPLHVEVHTMAYAYKRNTSVDNAIFYEYTVINKGPYNYTNFRMAQLADVDLGYFNDDYIGFDSVRGMGIVYNADTVDGGSMADTLTSYGNKVPIAAVIMLELSQAEPFVNNIGSFMYYNNDFSVMGNPSNGGHYSNYSRSKFKDGSHLKMDFTGSGISSDGYGTGEDTKYVFSGDPSVAGTWSECASSNVPGDRRFVIGSKDLTLRSGDTVFMAMALMVKSDTIGHGCPNASFAPIQSLADDIVSAYQTPPIIFPLNIAEVEQSDIKVYPNPATDYLTIDINSSSAVGQLYIHDVTGRQVIVSQINAPQSKLDVSTLMPGMYYLKCSIGNTIINSVFIKQ